MSEQIQGGLFDEKPTELSTADILGQSQTQEARYARNYRKNPENKKRINENRRKNRQMKKDQESRLSLVLESAASPITSKPQTVENLSKTSDNTSLSDLGIQENRVCNDLAQSEILRQLAEIKGELLRQRVEMQSLIKPTAPALPDDKSSEQQVSNACEKV